jgi:hypothetical protein
LLKVMSVMAESVVAIWSAPVVFVRLGAGAFTVKEKLALSVLSVAFFAVTVYTVRALTSVGVPLIVSCECNRPSSDYWFCHHQHYF